MDELPYPWDAYARFELQFSQTRCENRRRAIEAVMALLVSDSPPPEKELKRIYATATRRERHRRTLEAKYLHPAVATPDPSEKLQAQLILDKIEKKLSKKDWALLLAIGKGDTYSDIAESTGCKPGRLRIKAMRARQDIALYNPALKSATLII